MTNQNQKNCDIAIVGISTLFPGATSVDSFWQNILAKQDEIKEVPETHWLIDDYFDPDPKARDKTYGKRGGFIPEVDFEPMAFGLPPTALASTDSGQLLAMILAKQVLEDAYQGQFQSADKSKISVILGTTGSTELILEMAGRMERPKWVKALREEGLAESQVQKLCDRISDQYVEWQESSFPGLLANVVAGRIAHRLDLGGTNFVTDAACASSLAALNIALNELYLGNSDLVITGGVDALNTISMFMCFSKTPALSMTGDCRPFSNDADGTLLGEGIGMIAIKRLDDAIRDNDQVYAVIKGLGYSSDGKGKSVYAPVSEGQALCLQRAYQNSGCAPETIGLIEAHGTATKAGDVAEFNGLNQVFPTDENHRNYCALGSIKSNIGHTKASAGIAGVIKAVMALNHKTLPATIKVDKPNQKLNIEDSAFYLNTETRPWLANANFPRRAGVSSFGFGGTNFHVVLEEASKNIKTKAKRQRSFDSELYLFSSSSSANFTAETFNTKDKYKLAIVAKSKKDCLEKLEQAQQKISAEPEKNFELPNGIYYSVDAKPSSSAFLFPGQGSQYVNMGADIATHFDAAMALLESLADKSELQAVLSSMYPLPVFDKEQKTQQEDKLRQTEMAQPALTIHSLMLVNILQQLGIKADYIAGHSLGEVGALHAAGVLSDSDCISVAAMRGQHMSKVSSNNGAMLAVQLDGVKTQNMIDESQLEVSIANYNSPKQTIVAGTKIAIENFLEILKSHSIRASQLNVANAFHTSLVAEAVEPFEKSLAGLTFSKIETPLIANLDGKQYPSTAERIKKQLAGQIINSVQFVKQIETLYQAGVRTFIEVGAQSILTQLVKQILPQDDIEIIAFDKKGKSGIESLWQALAKLSVMGHELNIAELLQNHKAREPLFESQTKNAKPVLKIKINGTNYGKHYPPQGGVGALPQPNPEKAEPIPSMVSQPLPDINPVEKALPIENNLPTQQENLNPQPLPIETNETLSMSQHTELQALQQQLLNAQISFQETLAQSHQVFMETAQMTMQNGGNAHQPQPQKQQQSSVTPATSMPQASYQAPITGSDNFTNTIPPEQKPQVDMPTPQSAANVSTVMPANTESAAAGIDLKAVMLQVVAEKTGYPLEMLTLDMHLENDLGVDSIKRVEILAAFTEQVGELGELDNNEMAKRSTLQEMVEFIEQNQPEASEIITTVKESISMPAPVVTTAPVKDYKAIMLQVVAEKTGYPQDMLTLDMHLENDLGVDSIKRVEILAAFTEQVGELGELDNNEMAKRSTLQEMVEFIEQNQTTAAPQIAPSVIATPAKDYKAIMLQVVAQKTGYPQDMLTLDMHLENDLGVDSIKRVEILAAFTEQVGELGELDNNEMAKRSTLLEMVEFIEQNQTTAVPQAEPVESTVPEKDYKAIMLQVVAEKTGYPQDMLTLDMHLENDLGVDSIKRVEILAAFTEKVGELGELDNNEMAKRSTLQEMVEFIEQNQTGTINASIPAPQTSSEVTAINTPELADFHVKFSEKEALGMSQSILNKALSIAITDDATGYGKFLAQAFEAKGYKVQLVEPTEYKINNDKIGAFIFTEGLQTVETVEQATAISFNAFKWAREMAAVLNNNNGMWLSLQNTGGDFSPEKLAQAPLAAISGLTKTAAIEWPNVTVKAIDIELDQNNLQLSMQQILNEILLGGTQAEVGLLKNGKRGILLDDPQRSSNSDVHAPLKGKQVIVATGGARGVTAACLIELAKSIDTKICILGRTALLDEPQYLQSLNSDAELKQAILTHANQSGEKLTPKQLTQEVTRIINNREVKNNISLMEQAGSEVLYIPCDITEKQSVLSAIDEVKTKWQNIDALVHGAGVIVDKLIADKTDQQFEMVFNTKVQGLKNLLHALEAEPLSTVALFSSVAGRYGNQGQSDYAMANEAINKMAHAFYKSRLQQGQPCVVKSINWGPWDSGMVSSALKQQFKQRGIELIPMQQGAAYFVNELLNRRNEQIELVMGAKITQEQKSESSAPQTISIDLSTDEYQFLQGHKIKDQLVVPFMQVADWLQHLGFEQSIENGNVVINKFKCVNGIKQADLVAADWLLKINNANHKITLSSEQQVCHYQANVDWQAKAQVEPQYRSLPANSLQPVILPEPYDGEVLFHQDAFQVIKEISGSSQQGIAGVIQAKSKATTANKRVAVLDGGLQLAVLWVWQHSNQGSLPLNIERMTFHDMTPTAFEGEVQVDVFVVNSRSKKTTVDIVYRNAAGQIICEIAGLDLICHFKKAFPELSNAVVNQSNQVGI